MSFSESVPFSYIYNTRNCNGNTQVAAVWDETTENTQTHIQAHTPARVHTHYIHIKQVKHKPYTWLYPRYIYTLIIVRAKYNHKFK